MNNQSLVNQQPKKSNSPNKEQIEIQRRFTTLQAKRHQLEHELRVINAILLSMGTQIDQGLAYKQLQK